LKYGVIICPKCGMARGVESRRKTTTCQCGRKIKLGRIKYQFTTDSPIELARAVAEANAKIRSGGAATSSRRRVRQDSYSKIVERARPVKGSLERLHEVAKALTELRSEFDVEDLRKIASKLGNAPPEKMLARLVEHNLVYEVRDGKYRAV